MKKILMASAIVLGLCGLTAPAHSNVFTVNLNYEFSGGTPPAGPKPWTTLTFDDNDHAGSVKLSINTSGLTGAESINGLYLNFNPNLDLSELTFTPAAGNTTTADAILTGTDAFQADGDGDFDILFDFSAPPGQTTGLLGANQIVSYNIASSQAINVSSFDFLSAPDGTAGQFTAAAQVLGNATPAWIGPSNNVPNAPVPEPATMLLFGVGTAVLGFSRKRKK